ncbi:hypothetical protein MA16_Dca023711 [Dendrobium catenatum]|uniref:Uncharacterized protein n=1 Tax=Dendrobium catenatum TaxID=906689 RepID=A0A2I0XF72_9ASPA|nr:hypothetical protein MA16_Dca023711 [Dendrobium catenatum]
MQGTRRPPSAFRRCVRRSPYASVGESTLSHFSHCGCYSELSILLFHLGSGRLQAWEDEEKQQGPRVAPKETSSCCFYLYSSIHFLPKESSIVQRWKAELLFLAFALSMAAAEDLDVQGHTIVALASLILLNWSITNSISMGADSGLEALIEVFIDLPPACTTPVCCSLSIHEGVDVACPVPHQLAVHLNGFQEYQEVPYVSLEVCPGCSSLYP